MSSPKQKRLKHEIRYVSGQGVTVDFLQKSMEDFFAIYGIHRTPIIVEQIEKNEAYGTATIEITPRTSRSIPKTWSGTGKGRHKDLGRLVEATKKFVRVRIDKTDYKVNFDPKPL